MIFHLSIDAHEPKRVADVLARLWDADAYPFPPVGEGSWMVIAEDGRGSAIEVYPRGVRLAPGEGDADVYGYMGEAVDHTPTHFAVATPWTEAHVHEIAAAEGWRACTQSRGGMFRVIEVWLENRVMVEVLTDEMQAEYLAAVTPANWRAALERGRPAAA